MAELYVYDGAHVTLIRDGTVELTERADHGEIGTGKVSLDDAAGTYEVVGHKAFHANQDSCSVARTFTGYVGSRSYQRNTERTEAARFIDVDLLDLNARLGFKVIRGRSWNRRAETINQRLTALLASSFLSSLVVDDGFVDYPDHDLDKNDYRGQYPLDVIRDMALEVGYNYFVYWSDSASDAALWFRDSNASTAFSSTLQISNVSTDVDESTTFAASLDTTLDRDPSQVYSGAFMPFTKGNVYRTRTATATTYEPRDGVAPNSQVKKRSKAVALADHFLFERRNEEDVIHTTMLAVPSTKVNLVQAGQRIQAKFSHYATEGYGEYSWFRILEATKRPLNAEGALYDIPLTLSPQEAGCSVQPTFVQTAYQDSTGSAPGALPRSEVFPFTATTPGNLVIVAIQSTPLNANTITQVPPGGWTWQVQNDVMPDGGDLVNIFWKKAEGESSMDVTFLGATIGHEVRFNMVEYAGLTNPALYGSVTEHSEAFPTPGFATSASTSYPAGPAAVVFVGSMQGGPQSSDNLSSDATLRTAIAGTLHGSNEIAFADDLLDTTAGSLTRHFYFTGLEALDTYGLVFTGDECGDTAADPGGDVASVGESDAGDRTTGSTETCAGLSGLEFKFPCDPLSAGAMPAHVSGGTDDWDMFASDLYSGSDPFSAVVDPAGSGLVVVKNINRLGDSEKHTTHGTGRDMPKGNTSYAAVSWLWKDSGEFTPEGWCLVWQRQMIGSPIAALSVNEATSHWFMSSRNGTVQTKYDLGAIQYGHWAYLVCGIHLDDAPNGWIEWWFAHDGWPDVTTDPLVRRTGIDTWQGDTAHDTVGMYAEHFSGSSSEYIGYHLEYGRAATAARAIVIARAT